ncbi:hypothetical protein R2360_18265 [Mycobacteroides chelonae]|nr:hypothetical protein [Mycobacteroides chelonae]
MGLPQRLDGVAQLFILSSQPQILRRHALLGAFERIDSSSQLHYLPSCWIETDLTLRP